MVDGPGKLAMNMSKNEHTGNICARLRKMLFCILKSKTRFKIKPSSQRDICLYFYKHQQDVSKQHFAKGWCDAFKTDLCATCRVHMYI